MANVTSRTILALGFGITTDVIDFIAGAIPVIGLLIDIVGPIGLYAITNDKRSWYASVEILRGLFPPLALVADVLPINSLVALWIISSKSKKK